MPSLHGCLTPASPVKEGAELISAACLILSPFSITPRLVAVDKCPQEMLWDQVLVLGDTKQPGWLWEYCSSAGYGRTEEGAGSVGC